MRDTRDPQKLGEAILAMSGDHGMPVTEAADILNDAWKRPEDGHHPAPLRPEASADTDPPDTDPPTQEGRASSNGSAPL